MTIEETQIVLYKLQQLLYGYNYEVVFGIEAFTNCESIEEAKIQLKSKFPDSSPQSVALVPMTMDDFWNEIEFALEYRGDGSAGVQLSESKLVKFLQLKETFLSFLRESIKSNSEIFSYPDQKGIPGYPVWWDFSFIILSFTADTLFVYGSASD